MALGTLNIPDNSKIEEDIQSLKVSNTKIQEDIEALQNPEFKEASTRSNINSKESNATILGKIKKYFTDIKSHAFNDPVNNLTTTTTGKALDAYQGKVLNDKMTSIIIKGRASGKTAINIDMSKYINTASGDWVFLVFAHSRAALYGAHTLSIVSGVWSDYISINDIVKTEISPTISISDTTLTITFHNVDGGTYGIIPVSEVF